VEKSDDADGLSGHGDRCLLGSSSRLDVGFGEHGSAELCKHLMGLGHTCRRRFALEPSNGEALLGDGVGNVGRVLPEGELNDAHDEQQEQRGRDDEFGRD
jgi:hypothetical protein